MSRPSLLYVTPEIPSMTGSGMAIRAASHILALADLFHVSAAVATETPAQQAEARIPADVRAACAKLSVVSAQAKIVGLLASAKSPRHRMLMQAACPLSLSHARARAGLTPLADAVAAAHSHKRFDVLHCFRLGTAPIRPLLLRRGVSWRRSALDIDDYESFSRFRYVRDFHAALGLQSTLASYLDAVKLWLMETHNIPSFDDGYVCSNADQAMLARRFPRVNWKVLPNVVPKPPEAARQKSGTFTFIFVGSFDYGPNGDGLRFFASEVLPILRHQAVAPFRVIVAGRRPGPDLRRLAQEAGFELYADPPSLEPYYVQADVALVPVRFGAGTRIKLLEAFSFGLPVVSTELGAEGLELRGENDLLYANDGPAFAGACARLIADADLCERLAARGRALFQERFSQDSLRALIPKLHDWARAPQRSVGGAVEVGQ